MKRQIEPSDLADFRGLCEQRAAQLDPTGEAEVAFSGGTDSATILFSLLALGRRPRCLTFYVAGIESNDLRSARQICRHFKLPLTTVELPSDIAGTVADIRRLLPSCQVVKKTIVQCLQPWLYLYPAMQGPLILNGLGADDLYCNQRKVQVALHSQGEAAILQYRKVYSDDLNFSGGNIHRLAGVYGKRNCDFYHDPAIEAWFLQFEAKALHKPYEKYPSIAAFADFYRQGAFRRPHSSYQVNSGLREVHERLLLDPEINRRGRKAIVALYRDLADEPVYA